MADRTTWQTHRDAKNARDLTECLLVGGSESNFAHIIRESLRVEQWTQLTLRRGGFEGVFNGVDHMLTTHVLPRTRGLDKYKMRCIMTGALPTQNRLYRKGVVEDPMCPCCAGEIEDAGHVFLRCPAHRHIREREFQEAHRQAAPECLSTHGLLPHNFAFPPDVGEDKDAQRVYVSRWQYMLLDMWDNRLRMAPQQAPVPRWQPPQQQPQPRRVRQRVEVVAPAPTFVHGGELRTGANWQAN